MKNNITDKIKCDALDALLKHLEEGVHIVDHTGITLVYNKQMGKLEGIIPKDIIGKPFLNVFEELTTESSTISAVLNTGKPIHDRVQHYQHKGKSITTINSTIPIINNSELIGAMEIAKDVTKVRQLADQVAELTNIIHQGDDEKSKLKNKSLHPYTFESIIGKNKKFLEAIKHAKVAAENSATVLIVGETGTGKELIAQSIHNASIRKNAPFIAQNCAAIPESLLEGILFGTVKGSFTGAVDRPGLFEQANGGTILLDEINSMGLNLQAKLLRVLQEGYIRRVGGEKDVWVDIKIIATINEAPEIAIMKGQIRKDLFYRLSVINVYLPELKDRIDDIEILIDFFVKKYSKKYSKDIWHVSEPVKERFRVYDWPGNIRELENVIQSMITLLGANEHIFTVSHLPKKLSRRKVGRHIEGISEMGLDSLLTEVEIEQIKLALDEAGGNITRAAKILKINRQTLQHKIKKFKINAK